MVCGVCAYGTDSLVWVAETVCICSFGVDSCEGAVEYPLPDDVCPDAAIRSGLSEYPSD